MARDIKAGPKATPKSKGPQLPVILSGNDLLEGDVVYLGVDGWTRDPRAARVGQSAEEAEAMEAEGKAAAAANLIVEPYLVPVAIEADGFARALHFREAIRQKGPSIHPDMGKQAEFGQRP